MASLYGLIALRPADCRSVGICDKDMPHSGPDLVYNGSGFCTHREVQHPGPLHAFVGSWRTYRPLVPGVNCPARGKHLYLDKCQLGTWIAAPTPALSAVHLYASPGLALSGISSWAAVLEMRTVAPTSLANDSTTWCGSSWEGSVGVRTWYSCLYPCSMLSGGSASLPDPPRNFRATRMAACAVIR